MLHDPFGVSTSFSVSQVSRKITIGSDFVTGISRRMCGPYEGYLFPGIFMHQLLPDRRRFGFGRISFIALAEDIEIAGKKDDDDDGSKYDSHCVLLSGTHAIRLFVLAETRSDRQCLIERSGFGSD